MQFFLFSINEMKGGGKQKHSPVIVVLKTNEECDLREMEIFDENAITDMLNSDFDLHDDLCLLIKINFSMNNKLEIMVSRLDRLQSWTENIGEAVIGLEGRIENMESVVHSGSLGSGEQ